MLVWIMNWIPKTARRTPLFLVALLALVAACTPANSQSLPDDYLGRWYYTGSSGGIAGDGMGDDPVGYIVITADNTIETYRDDGALVSTESFTPSLGPSIFTTTDVWLLDADSFVPRAIRTFEDGTVLTISDNVYDGFSLGYARSR